MATHPRVLKYIERLKSGDKPLKKIKLGWCDLTHNDIVALCEALKVSHSGCRIQKLYASGGNIGDEGMNAFADAMKFMAQHSLHSGGCRIQTLSVGCNKIGVEGMKALADAMKFMAQHNPGGCRIQKLEMSGNNIGAEGMKVLADAMKVMAQHSPGGCHLQTLYMCDNNIGVEGVKALADAMKFMAQHSPEGCRIQELEVSFNNTGVEGMNVLADAMRVMISVSYNTMPTKGGCRLHILYAYDNITQSIYAIIEKMRKNSFKNSFMLRSQLFCDW